MGGFKVVRMNIYISVKRLLTEILFCCRLLHSVALGLDRRFRQASEALSKEGRCAFILL